MGTNFPEVIATFFEAHVNMAAPFPACFCHCCSFKIMDPAYRYCPKCGTEVFRVASSAESTRNTTEPPDSPKTRKFFLPSFKSYKAKKGSERSSFFRAKSTKGTKKSKLEPEKEVTISVGVMTSKETVKRGENLPLKILPSATHIDILVASIAKHRAFNKRFDGKAEYRLVYKDGSEVKSIPGTSPPEPFTLNRYKEESGFGYARIVFYFEATAMAKTSRERCRHIHMCFKEGRNDLWEISSHSPFVLEKYFCIGINIFVLEKYCCTEINIVVVG